MKGEDRKKKILFICIGNACRSPMAEGFAKKYGKGRIEAFSAGIFPIEKVSRGAVKVMREVGIDISSHVPKHVEEVLNGEKHFDLVIILDRSIDLYNLPADEVLIYDIPDPFNRSIEEYRKTRDMVERVVITALKKLGVRI